MMKADEIELNDVSNKNLLSNNNYKNSSNTNNTNNNNNHKNTSQSQSMFINFDKEPGMVIGESIGYYPKNINTNTNVRSYPHILAYNMTSIRHYLAPFISSDLTVCHSAEIWSKHLIMIIYALFLMILLGYTAFPDNKMGETSACSDDDNRNSDICKLNATLEQAKGAFQFLIAFILAGYVAKSVDI